MSRTTTASLNARIDALEALVAELKDQRDVAPIAHHAPPSPRTRVAAESNAIWQEKKAAAIAEAKRTGKTVVVH